MALNGIGVVEAAVSDFPVPTSDLDNTFPDRFLQNFIRNKRRAAAMSVLSVTTDLWEANRARTLATLDEIDGLPEPPAALAWRPGPGRAHIAWQLMHIGIAEELFATERLMGTVPAFPSLMPRFRGGSTPDDNIPSIDEIRDVLENSRQHLLSTLSSFDDADLDTIPAPLQERGWSIGKVLEVLTWHEPHHQGQAHITLNLWKAAQS